MSNTSGSSQPYTLTLSQRSKDPAGDAAHLPRHKLPSHHVPTILSRATQQSNGLLKRAASSMHGGKPSPSAEEADDKSRPAKVKGAVKTVVKKATPGLSVDEDSEGQAHSKTSALPHLAFENPWPSFRTPTIRDALQGGLKWGLPKGYKEGGDKGSFRHGGAKLKGDQVADVANVEVTKPTWADEHADKVRVTWLGHASTLVSFPALGGEGSRPFNVLFDAVFSERCSPSQAAGPARFTPSPCQVDDLPPIDLVLLSHSHYDHLDTQTMAQLLEQRGDALHVLVPLGNRAWFEQTGFKSSQVSELDWYDSASFTFSDESKLKVVCTPAQHGSGRAIGDANSTLWSSWLLERVEGAEAVKDEPENEGQGRFRVFFGGDTGLGAHNESRKPRDAYPVCPIFRDVSIKFGVPHVLLLPISVGSSLSYLRGWDPLPRRYSPFPRVESPLMSAIHMDAKDAAKCAKIMSLVGEEGEEAERARKRGPKNGVVALAVHYGTFVRNDQQTMEDVRMLAKACVDQTGPSLSELPRMARMALRTRTKPRLEVACSSLIRASLSPLRFDGLQGIASASRLSLKEERIIPYTLICSYLTLSNLIHIGTLAMHVVGRLCTTQSCFSAPWCTFPSHTAHKRHPTLEIACAVPDRRTRTSGTVPRWSCDTDH